MAPRRPDTDSYADSPPRSFVAATTAPMIAAIRAMMNAFFMIVLFSLRLPKTGGRSRPYRKTLPRS